MIVPVLVKAGLIFGASGGHGVLLVRGKKKGDGWSYPAFNFTGSVTFGLQIGAEAAQVVLMIMSDRGINAMLSTEFKLGADISVAVGPVGAGAQAATTDVLAFSMAKGLFGGLTVEGAVIKPSGDWNSAYYGKPVDMGDIVIRRKAKNAGADALRAALAKRKKG
jgi:lipid-binding SYLF domain-containing protein